MAGAYTVVVPLFRNARQIPELVRRLLALPGARLLLVEDAGGDAESKELLRSLADERVGVFLLTRNVGQQRAILAGLRHTDGGVAVVMDGDLQDPPEAVPLLLAGLQRAAVVFAQRVGGQQPWLERATSFLFKGIFRLASGFRLPASVGTFVALRPEVVRFLGVSGQRHPYLVGMLALSGFPMASVAVARSSRGDSKSSYRLRTRLELAWRALSCFWPGRGLGPVPVEVEERLGWVARTLTSHGSIP